MVIAITAYTEPVPVTPPNISADSPADPLHLESDEYDELEETGEFAKILAGLLQKSETPEIALHETDGVELLGDNLSQAAVSKSKSEFTDDEIPQEHLYTMTSADHLLINSIEEQVDADAVDFLREVTNVREKLSTEAQGALIADSSVDAIEVDSADVDLMHSSLANIAQIDAENTDEDTNRATGATAAEKRASALSKADNAEALLSREAQDQKAAALRDRQEPGKLEEARNRSRRDRVSFDIRDMRSGSAESLTKSQTHSFAATQASATRVQGDAQAREITLELRLPDNGSASQSAATWEAKAPMALENMLARELHQNFNGDIVRHASMALRDGGEATIRLALKPDTLGNVKIRLEMTENKITGQIVV
ncbi:MAG: hypothetical protein LBU66_00575, partial [Treponema sp.]|nr:hypothetical protein [Treponema sp.]